MNTPLIARKWLLCVPVLLMCLAFSGAGNQESDKLITLVIDAGHGGKDPGKPAGSKKYKHEKDINLDIALKVGKLLEDNVKGLKIIYTRKTDKWVNLDNRVIIANRAKADLFLSIHCNSNPNRHIYGTRTHFHDYRSVSTQKLAKAYESAYARAGRKSRGVQSTHDRGMSLFVLENTKMTAILTEVGFITNPTEEKYLNSSLGQTKLAKAIYDATVAHLKSTHGVKLKNGEVYYQVQILASSKN